MIGEGYITGSAARKPEEREMVRRDAQGRGRRRIRHRRRVITMRGYAVFFLAACLMTMIFLNQYLMLQSSVRRHTQQVSLLKTRLDTAKRDNDDLEERIETSLNLAYVYDYAVRELGLVPVKSDQVMTFDRAEQEYVMQQEDLPRF